MCACVWEMYPTSHEKGSIFARVFSYRVTEARALTVVVASLGDVDCGLAQCP